VSCWIRRRRVSFGAESAASPCPPSESRGEVSLTMSANEALVLFDWLARTSDATHPVPFADPAEQLVLWNVEALLERVLVAPLTPDYDVLLDDARRRVRHGDTSR